MILNSKRLLVLSLALSATVGCQFLKSFSRTPTSEPQASQNKTGSAREPSASRPAFPLGVRKDGDGLRFTIRSYHAEKVQLLLFSKAMFEPAKKEFFLDRADASTWTLRLSDQDLKAWGLRDVVLYAYRFWGPNWKFDAQWKPGSRAGFISHVDGEGNRFNPNKVLFDPYALELTHDPRNLAHRSGLEYASGESYGMIDNSQVVPKGIYTDLLAAPKGPLKRVTRKFKDEIIYEAHVRGLTMNNLSIKDERLRGTYKGATVMIPYLKSLGITAIQFLPVQETQNDHNDIDPNSSKDDQYWGYMTLNYFSPDRRYAFDKSPGGPTREFREMVNSFHEAGIKVYLDVVYNHTGEGGLWDSTGDTADLFSFRGIDNQAYYLLAGDKKYYYDNTGCGHNINSSHPIVTNLVIDSLQHWKSLGVDGFRFDLAAVLGNECERNCARFNKMKPDNILNRTVQELPGRDLDADKGLDLIAEPWAINMYALGDFPRGWAEWNGVYRDTIRKKMNKLGYARVTAGDLIRLLGGSRHLYEANGRKPYHSVNFLVAHDGFTLRDLFSYNDKNNQKPWPNGPSDGGEEHNESWDQGGSPADQMKAVKNAMTILMLSAGTPMFTAGDEQYRTQLGNNNAYNLDTTLNWLNWSEYAKSAESKAIFAYTQKMIQLRKQIGGIRRFDSFFAGRDLNGQNGKDITWLNETGEMPGSDYDNPDQNLVGYRLDLTEDSQASSADPRQVPSVEDRGNWKTLVVYFNFDWRDKSLVLPFIGFGGPGEPSFLPNKWKVLSYTGNLPFSQISSDGRLRMESRSSLVLVELK